MKKAVLILTVWIGLFSAAASAQVMPIIVINTNDSGIGSLRDAVNRVNMSTPAGQMQRIEFGSDFDTPQTISLMSRLSFDYGTRVEIIGRGNHTTTLTTNPLGNLDGVLELNSIFGRVHNLRFANAESILGDGAAITVNDAGIIKIERCIFENNRALGSGGAVFVEAGTSVLIEDSSFFNNNAGNGNGGAVFLEGYDQTILRSTFSGNLGGSGAAVYVSGFGDFTTSTITNSTFTGNSSSNGSTLAHAQGAGFLNLTNITVASNTAGPMATDQAVFSGSLIPNRTNLTNSIVSLNSSGNINSAVTETGTNMTTGDPLLGALAYNGGETPTRALLPGSPAIGVGSGGAPPTDQRGAAAAGDLGAYQSGTVVTSVNTLPGSPVTVPIGSVSVTFGGVTQAGTTTQIPIPQSGTPPGGYSFGTGFPAFQISTTAVYTAPVTICMQVPFTVPLSTFNAMEILHFENGMWVPLSPTTRDIPTYTICAPTNTLSPFAAAQRLAPTAANVSISGRVLTPEGRGLTNAIVYLTDNSGNTRSARTSSFGYYRFDEIEAGQSVLIRVRSKQYQFEPRVIAVKEDLVNLDFVPVENTK